MPKPPADFSELNWRGVAFHGAVACAAVSMWGAVAAANNPERAASGAMSGVEMTQATRTFTMTLPLIFQSAYLGDVPVSATPDGRISVNVERIIALLGERISAKMVEDLKRSTQGNAVVAIDTLAADGVIVTYDAEKLELHASVPVNSQGGQSISVFERGDYGRPSLAAIPPEPFSGSLTLTARQTYIWDPQPRWAPLRIAGNLAMNFFGPNGVHLFAQGDYDASARSTFNRGNVTLVHDDAESAIRYALGDVAPAPAGFQSSPLLGGVSVQRLFSEIQPFTNIRPTGLYHFSLDHPSTVDVVVNGATIRSLHLDAGQYDLRDFPLSNGLNDVQLYVIDEFGRRLIANLSLFYGTRLLNEGVFEFGATAGAPQARKPGGQLSYQRDLPTFSGYARYGLTEDVTIGANFQGNEAQRMGGLELGWASPIGTFGFLGGWSQDTRQGDGQSYLASYEFAAEKVGFLDHPRLNLEYVYTSRSFSPVQFGVDDVSKKHEIRARLSNRLPLDFGLGLSTSFAKAYDLEPDEKRYAMSLSHRLGPGDLTASYESVQIDNQPDDNRLLLTFSVSLNQNESVRASYDSNTDRREVEYNRYQRDELGDYGIRAKIQQDNEQLTGTGEFAYNANRFSVVLEHDAISDNAAKHIQSQETSYTIATQIAFAGDAVAIGRPVGHRFAIVSAHDTLEGSWVGVRGANIGGSTRQSEADGLGPALASAGPPYQPGSIRTEVDDLPPGYDAGPGQYDVDPGLASGYAIQVGSDASHIVRGVLLDNGGHPLASLGGEIRADDRKDFQPVPVFTNSAGRFVTEGLAPGHYQLVLGTDGEIVVPMIVPPDAKGIIDVGTVRVPGGPS